MRRLAVLLLFALALPVSGAHAWTWPVNGPVLRPFVFDRAHPYAAGLHRGVDLGAPTGSPVLAPAEGVVKFAGTVPTGGKTVSIETPSGHTATLVHLGSYVVKRGEAVVEGAVVGTVGPSGVTDLTEPFVYFGVRTTSDPQGYLDPLTFLPARPAVPVATPASEHAEVPAAPTVEASAEAAQALPGGEIAAPAPASAAAAAQPAQPVLAPVAEVPAAPVEPSLTVASSAHDVLRPEVEPDSVLVVDPNATDLVLSASVPLAAASKGGGVARQTNATPTGIRATGHSSVAVPDTRASAAERAAARTPRPSAALGDRGAPAASVSDRSSVWPSLGLALALAALGIAGLLAAARRDLWARVARIITSVPEPEHVDRRAEPKTAEDSGRPGLAVRVREAAPGPRGRLRGPGGHLRALPPAEGQRCLDGERDRRARDAGHGHGRSRGRLAA